MRAYADKFDSNKFPGTRVFIGETYLPNVAELDKQYGPPDHPEFQLPMDTQIGFINKLDVAAFRAKLTDAETAPRRPTSRCSSSTTTTIARLDARYGDGVHDTDIERVISTILFASRGASLFYYGDEIGMKTTPPTRKEDVKDPVGITGWPKDKGRDGERTPMQWNAAGQCRLYSARTQSLAAGSAQLHPQSTCKARRGDPEFALRLVSGPHPPEENQSGVGSGADTMLDPENPNVLSWKREAAGAPPVVVALNFTAEPQTVNLAGRGLL